MAGIGSRFKDEGYEQPKPLINVLDDENVKSLLRKTKPDCLIYEIDYLTEGPASTCLLTSDVIDCEEPLVIANCDQIMEWDSELFVDEIQRSYCDGAVVTYSADTNKNSYVKIDSNGHAVEFAEKRVISEFSLNGIHYWKHGSDFVSSTKKMIEKNIRVNNEFYIAPTYNELILNKKKIIIHHINKSLHHAVGTPEDLKKYEDLQTKRNA